MTEMTRLIGMLQASAAQNELNRQASNSCRPLDCGLAPFSPPPANSLANSTRDEPTPTSLLEALQLGAYRKALPKHTEPLSTEFYTALNLVLSAVNAIFPCGANHPSASQVKETTQDTASHLSIATCKRIFAAAENPAELQAISVLLRVPCPNPNMASRFPSLTTTNLPPASAAESSATASPARGTAMLNSIFKSVRVPEFRFKWQFWAEKGQQSAPSSKDKSASATAEEFASRPKPLGEQIISVKEFYQHFNNIPVESLKLRDSIHLFHLGIKPLWEDPRNTRGGAYYFRIGKDVAAQFWHEICLLAVGDVLQGAVETKRDAFNDDICGLSYSVRWNAVQIAVWTRDADNEAGKEKLLAVILDKLSEELTPKKDSYWYKAHKEHKGFSAPA